MIVAGTGHRPNKLGGYSNDVANKLFLLAVKTLQLKNATKVITGMALGWDMALAKAAIHLDIPFIAAVPCDGQETRWAPEMQEEYRRILASAEQVIMVSPGPYEGWKMQKRNEWMIDNCDEVLALWDGTSGGTRNCVKYAQKKTKNIQNVWDLWEGQSV